MQAENDGFFFSLDLDEDGMYFGQIQEVGQPTKTLEMLLHFTPHTLRINMTCHLLLLLELITTVILFC